MMLIGINLCAERFSVEQISILNFIEVENTILEARRKRCSVLKVRSLPPKFMWQMYHGTVSRPRSSNVIAEIADILTVAFPYKFHLIKFF